VPFLKILPFLRLETAAMTAAAAAVIVPMSCSMFCHVSMLYFPFFPALSFAILIARTFFMILRNVALSDALNVVLAITEILLMKRAKSNANF